ncbi:MAG: CHAT domain-containing tetratricopeptide repeat protein [Scytonema sp. PMC 1069.18]|nr:CHAT domain-containing tetratricopeptide repeat protein [Scytonema sp. PMC 1069.18]MEC4880166.1 CHAT domain-containing tetratricopeptide repeat protein [Scytonema sp. PMC 1070.18]
MNEKLKAEAEQLLQQGIEQNQNKQYETALQSCLQALKIYREIKDRQGEGQTLKNLVNIYYVLGDYAKVVEYQQQVLIIARESNNSEVEGEALSNLGVAYYQLGDYSKAVENLQQGLTIGRSIDNRQMECINLVYLGQTYASWEEYTKAAEYYEQALPIARELKNRSGEGALAGSLALAYEQLGNYEKATEYYQLMLTVAQEFQNTETETAASRSLERLKLGLTPRKLEEAQQQIEQARQQLQQARENNNPAGVALALINSGRIDNEQGNLKEAQETLELALQLIQDLKNPVLKSQAVLELGAVYISQQNTKKAIELWQEGLAISQNLKTSQLQQIALDIEKVALLQLSYAYQLEGDLQRAIDCRQQDLEIAQSIDDKLRQAEALNELGSLYQERDNYVQAIKFFQESLEVAETINNPRVKAQSLRNLGNAYFSIGDFPQAINYAQQALEITEKFKSSQEDKQILSLLEREFLQKLPGEVLPLLGSAYLFGCIDSNQVFSRKNSNTSSQQAEQYFQRNIELAKIHPNSSQYATALGNLGVVYSVLGKYDPAIDYLQQALTIQRSIKEPKFEQINRQIEGINLRFLGWACTAKGDTEQAIKYSEESLAIAQADENLLGKAGALGNLGRTLFLAGNLPEAENRLREAIAIFENIRTGFGKEDLKKVSFFDVYTDVYELQQQVLIAQNKFEEALEVAEKGRARAFAELLASRAGLKELQVPSPNLQQIQNIAKEQNATLVEYSIIYDSSQTLIPARIQGLQPNQESKLFIWVVQPTGKVNFCQVDLKNLGQVHKKSLADFVFNSRESIGVRGRDAQVLSNPEHQERDAKRLLESKPQDTKQFLQQLYNLLIEPIEQLLPTDENAHVIFIPQGTLFLLPFAALQDKSGKYLVEKHTIRIAPSIQVLDFTRHQKRVKQQGSEVFIVGNPTMPKIALEIGKPPQPLRPLPGSRQEAIEIALLLKTKYLTGDEATKSAILQNMPKARIIHLATHGLLDDFKGKNVPGAIALAPYGEDDGILTADEILDQELNAELLVLSACNTGRGRVTGDSVVGLSRSFISAGVSSIVVSLWAVPDTPTAFLMKTFYQNLENNFDKAQALRQAMLTAKEQNPNLQAWAAFILIGEA